MSTFNFTYELQHDGECIAEMDGIAYVDADNTIGAIKVACFNALDNPKEHVFATGYLRCQIETQLYDRYADEINQCARDAAFNAVENAQLLSADLKRGA